MPRNHSPERVPHYHTDVTIIGSGGAGTGAAWKLSKQGISHIIVEAKRSPNGRIKTNQKKGPYCVEEGGELLHGLPASNIIHSIAAELGLRIQAVNLPERQYLRGRFAEKDDGIPTASDLFKIVQNAALKTKSDPVHTSMSQLIDSMDERDIGDRCFAKRVIANDVSGDISNVSVAGFLDLKSNGYENNFRLEKGYGELLSAMRGDSRLMLNQIAHHIRYDSHGVTIDTNRAVFHSRYAIVTLPIGVLQSGTVKFRPYLLEDKWQAIHSIAPGKACKMIFTMDSPLDESMQAMIETTLDSQLWWPSEAPFTLRGRMMTALIAGNAADRFAKMSNDEATHAALEQLGFMFGKRLVPRVRDVTIRRWHLDPFIRGSYSYIPVGVDPSVRKIVARNEGRVFFAGEAGSEFPGTVHGAILSGMQAAEAIGADAMHHRRVEVAG